MILEKQLDLKRERGGQQSSQKTIINHEEKQ